MPMLTLTKDCFLDAGISANQKPTLAINDAKF